MGKATKDIGTDIALATPLSMVAPAQVRWLWTFEGLGLIPVGSLTVLAGRGGVGKTSLVLSLVAALSRGELAGDFFGHKFPSVLCTREDDAATVSVPRLVAAGADLNNVFAGEVGTTYQDGSRSEARPMRFPDDMAVLRGLVREHGVKLVLIDPANSAMRGGLSPNSLEDVREAFEPLARLAREEDCAVVLITHFNKGQGSASDKLTGSTAWRDLARSVLLCVEDTRAAGEVVLSVDKSNYSITAGASLRYRLESVPVPVNEHGETVDVGKAVVLGASDVSVQDLLNNGGGADDGERSELEEWLLGLLGSVEGGLLAVEEIMKIAAKEGFSKERVRRARRGLPEIELVSSGDFPPRRSWQLVRTEAA